MVGAGRVDGHTEAGGEHGEREIPVHAEEKQKAGRGQLKVDWKTMVALRDGSERRGVVRRETARCFGVVSGLLSVLWGTFVPSKGKAGKR